MKPKQQFQGDSMLELYLARGLTRTIFAHACDISYPAMLAIECAAVEPTKEQKAKIKKCLKRHPRRYVTTDSGTLRLRRQSKGVPARSVSDGLGLAESTYWKWENFTGAPSALDEIEFLCRALSCTPDDLASKTELVAVKF